MFVLFFDCPNYGLSDAANHYQNERYEELSSKSSTAIVFVLASREGRCQNSELSLAFQLAYDFLRHSGHNL